MTTKTKTQISEENSEMKMAKDKLSNLKSQLTALDEKIASRREESLVENNAQKILDGVDVSELGQSEPLQAQRQALMAAIAMQTHEIQQVEAKKKIRLLLKRPWGDFSTGDKILCGESKGRRLIDSGHAVEIPAKNRKGEYLKNEVRKRRLGELVRIRLVKQWGQFYIGDVINAGESKAWNLIDKKIAELTDLPLTVHKKYKPGDTIRLELVKDWGGFAAGSVLDFGASKGLPLIGQGIAVEVSRSEKLLQVEKFAKKEVAVKEPVTV